MKSILFGLFLFLIAKVCLAQSRTLLPVQQHKLLWADSVYKEAVATRDTFKLAEAYYLYGKTYEAARDLLVSRQWFLKSLAIIEPRGNSWHLARLYSRLAGSELTFVGNYREAKKYAYQTLKVAKAIQDDRFLEDAYGRLLTIYETDWSRGGKFPSLNRPDPDSVAYYRVALDKMTNKRIRDTLSYATDTLYLIQMKLADGKKLQEQKKYTESIRQIKSAMNLAALAKRETLRIEAMTILAGIYLETEQFDLAESMLYRAEQKFSQSAFQYSYVSKMLILDTYKTLYAAKGNWRRAYEYAEKFSEQERINFISDRDEAVSRLQIEYETEKKELLLKTQQEELELRAKNNAINKRLNLLLILLLLITAGMSTFFYRLYRKNQRISRQNEMLVREQNHRVKNNLQAISSLLSLQSQDLEDSETLHIINESRLRVETMAILHRKLYADEHIGHIFLPDFLEEIAESVLTTYGYTSVQLTTEYDPVYLKADKAVHLGLILNELITNSCKYAFPSHPSPQLDVTCRRHEERNKSYISLMVSDNGLDSDTGTSEGGFGMQLIEMEVMQLYGKYDFSYLNGTAFSMTFDEYNE